MNNNEMLMRAIYETKREQLMLGWLDADKRKYMNDAYVYAHNVRMYPFFQHDATRSDPFETIYDIKKELVKEVIEFIDKVWLADKESEDLQFYNLETKFSSKLDRHTLMCIIRYCYISDRFCDNFYSTAMSNAPVEVHNNLNNPLEESNLWFT